MSRHVLLQHIVVGSVLLFVSTTLALAQQPEEKPEGVAPESSRSVTTTPKCKWQFEKDFVVNAKFRGKDRAAIDAAIDALVKALGAADPEVKAVTKAIEDLGPGGDIVDVTVVCKCVDSAGNVVKRLKESVDPNDEIHWGAKAHASGGAENARVQKLIVNKLCAKHNR